MHPHGLLEQALIYLAAGVIAVPICARLGLGSVLGYLLAGVIIGPWGLGLIQQPETLLQFAEFGVVMLLFLIGLELELDRLWALRRSIFGMGATQVLVIAAAVTGAAYALGLSAPVALVAGMGFAMSSTAIGLATLQEKNLLGTPGGQASFAVLLFQELAVIPLLLVVGLLAEAKTALDWLAPAKRGGRPDRGDRGRRPLPAAPAAARHRRHAAARGVRRLLAAAGARHRRADGDRRPVDGARRLPRRRAARRLGVPPRARARHRAVQG